MSGYLLILTVLLLGGSIATIGDRLGFRVGKARLSVFGLRPRDTAVVATITTGIIISAVTMGLILIFSEQVRVGLFELDGVLSNLQEARSQKAQIQQELASAQGQRGQAEAKLKTINKTLQAAQIQQRAAAQRLQGLQGKIVTLQKRSAATEQQARLAQSKLAQAEVQFKNLKSEEMRLLSHQKDLQASNNDLQTKLVRSRRELVRLNNEKGLLLTTLAKGDFIILDGEILITGIIREGLTKDRQRELLNVILAQAEQEVLKRGSAPAYGTNRALLIRAEVIAQVLAALSTEHGSIVEIQATQNVLKGVPALVTARVLPDNMLFHNGEVLASSDVGLPQPTKDLQLQLELLFQQASAKARSAGILLTERGDVGIFPAEALTTLLGELGRYKGAVTVQAIATNDIYTRGPLTLTLVVLQNGKVLTRVT